MHLDDQTTRRLPKVMRFSTEMHHIRDTDRTTAHGRRFERPADCGSGHRARTGWRSGKTLMEELVK